MNKPRRNVGRKSSASFTTRSGKTIKVNRSLMERGRARKEEKARAKAAYLSTLPKNRWKRLAYRLHPQRLAAYWFSREGAIMALKVTGIGILACFLIIVGVFAYFRKDLPKLNDISGNNIGGSITYYDRTGQTVLWQDYDAVQRYPVEWDNISKHMKNATVAIEDKNFYNHGAIDVAGLTRAVVNNATGGTTQGGSTITQQLVKLNQDWTEDRTITRKVKELILAVELERQYSKDDILKGYLNIAPYGGIEYGVEAAARNYFHTSAKDLTLAQSAFLAAIPQSPSYYSPYADDYGYNEEALVGRMHYILDQMVDQGYATKAEASEAKNTDVVATVQPRKPKYQNMQAPYFVLAAKAELEQRWGEQTVQRGGWKVTTTLDLALQAEAEKQVSNGMRQIQRQGGDVAAFAAADVETGQMVALVGGSDFSNEEYGQLNFAQTFLPPGSSFKPYDYAALIESTGAGAGSVIYDTQGPIPGYPCTVKTRPQSDPENANCLWDYDFRYPGPVTIRYALGGSRNVPAVKAMLMAGVEKTIDTAEAMGLTSGYNCYADDSLTEPAQCYGSSAIGDGAYLKLDEHVNSFATFSRGGKYVPRTYILKIVDAGGKTISEFKQPEAKQAIREDTAYIMADMMSDPRASYLARKIQDYKGWKFAVKTGTTNDSKDGLMMGYSTKYAAGVWVGYHDRSKAMTGFMENMTTPIWNGWMQAAHANLTAKNWTKPAGVKTEAAFVIRSHVGSSSREPSPATDLYPSWYKAKTGGSSSQTIDKVSGKVATDCTPELAKQTANNANTDKFSVDTFVTGGASSGAASGSDDVHNCGDTKPSANIVITGTCKVGDPCTINVTPAQGTHALVDPGRAGAGGGTVRVVVNGQEIGSKPAGSAGVPLSFSFTPSAAGSFSVEATVVDSVLYSGSSSSTLIVQADD